MKFGDNLKNIRKYKKISQEELADKLGVSRQSISKWETGENYPSMTNIMCLCDIFNCKINELVHEDMTDIDSLDEEIKMSAVKFKKDEQKKMKGISKFISIFARISKVVCIIGIVIFSLVSIAFVTTTIAGKIDTENKTITVFNHETTYEINENEIKIGSTKIGGDLTTYEVDTINKALETTKPALVISSILLSISLMSIVILTYKISDNIDKLFTNIHDNDTPFNMDNVEYIKKVAIYTFACLLLGDIPASIVELITTLNLNIDISLDKYIMSLGILAISYVFKYGYEIQLDSKGKIYGDIDE